MEMARCRVGTVLGWVLYSPLPSSPQLPLLAMAGAAQGAREAFVLSCWVSMVSCCFTLVRTSRLTKIVYNSLKVLTNWSRCLSIRRHPNSRCFCRCHDVLPSATKSNSFVFILMSTLPFVSGPQTRPSSCSQLSSTDSCRNLAPRQRYVAEGCKSLTAVSLRLPGGSVSNK